MDGASFSKEPSPATDDKNELSRSMNAASKHYHTHLNRLILSRLPLALPPRSGTPELYVQGLMHFAPIYMTFESLWERLTASESDAELPLETAVVLSALIHLSIPQLQRTERLLADLSTLARVPQDEVIRRLYTPRGDRLLRFLAHIEESAEARPHVLIAYAWVMYMALFNGGFWIRTQLAAARDSSWHLGNTAASGGRRGSGDEDIKAMGTGAGGGGSGGTEKAADRGLSFWAFDGERDGLEWRDEFKARLAEVESMLSVGQRDEIVHEARVIFQHCGLLVQELDEIVAQEKVAKAVENRRVVTSWVVRWLLPFGFVAAVLARSVVSSMRLCNGGGNVFVGFD